jgi:predicted transcriptional regulator
MTYEAGEDASAEEREVAAAMKRFREHRIVFHGLRKNAVIMLLEVGCTEDEVGAIVGMPPAMVRHYAKEVRRHHLAINAMKKLETGWAEIRKNVLGAAKAAS